MTKEYQVSDLFYTAWKDLDDLTHSQVYTLYLHAQSLALDNPKYGYALIAVLRALRKNKRLIDKINVPQAVDIYNDMQFLKEPWYNFPELPDNFFLKVKPDAQLARTSFDQFIYADNEWSGFLAAEEDHEKYLRRLAVTLYRPLDETVFDKESVDEREQKIKSVSPELLQLVFYTFGHVRNAVVKRCKTLLPPAPRSEDETSKKPQRTGAMWYNIKHQAAKTLVFGSFDEVGRTNMYHVLDHLEILSKEKEERRAKH